MVVQVCALDLRVEEAGLEDLARAAARGGGDLGALRAAGGPVMLVTRFAGLPWLSALLVAPADHVWCDVPAGTTESVHVPGFPTCGPRQSRWLAQQANDRKRRTAFKRELEQACGAELPLPRGLLGFDGGILHGAAALGTTRNGPRMGSVWFKSFLLPADASALERLKSGIESILRERGAFALRPCPDSTVALEAGRDAYSLADDRRDAMLLSQVPVYPHPLGNPAEVAARVLDIGRQALGRAGGEEILALSECSPMLGPAVGLNLPIADYSHSSVMDPPRQLNDEIVSIRLEIVRRLGWPVFARQMLLARGAVAARLAGRRPFGKLPFDPKQTIDAYLKALARAYPLSLGWPIDDVWAVD